MKRTNTKSSVCKDGVGVDDRTSSMCTVILQKMVISFDSSILREEKEESERQ